MEIKTMTTTATVNEAVAIATQMDKNIICTFGDERFKKGVKSEYRLQYLHHAVVTTYNLVSLVVASNRNII
jgi:hypothetical protein